MTLFLIFSSLLSIIIYFTHGYFCSLLNIFDEPDISRKLHHKVTSLIGGSYFFLCFILNFTVYCIFSYSDLNFLNLSSEIFSLFFSFTLIFLIGLYDDKYNLSANYKLVLIFIILILLHMNL